MIYDAVMATLGEAFIAVHADMAPFRRELKSESKAAAEAFEKDLGKAVEDAVSDGADRGGRAGGKRAGKGLGDGIADELGDKGADVWLKIAGALGSALDNGISSLPNEVKAAIVFGILAASPIILSALAGAIGTGIAAGFIGLGVALATQFESVQTRWASFVSNIRKSFVSAAEPFETALLGVLDIAEDRFAEWEPMLKRIFGTVSQSLEPIVTAALDAFEYILDAVDANLENIDILAGGIADAIYILGDGLSTIIDLIVSLGDDGRKAFLDMVYFLTAMAVGAVELVTWMTKAYNIIRDIAQGTDDLILILAPFLLLFKGIANEVDNASVSNKAYAYTNVELGTSATSVISATKAEEKAMKELADATKKAADSTWYAIDSQIAFEEALDDIQDSIKENGKTLKIETEEGRNNLRALGNAIKIAQKDAQERTDAGVMNAEQIVAAYNAEIERIFKAAEAQGISRDRIREIYGAQLDLIKLPPPSTEWLQQMAQWAAAAAFNLEKANKAAWNLPNRVGGPQPFAEGGIVRGPTVALIGEAGTEAVIPMTRPARAAAIMRQSGLDRMFGGSGDVQVSVYLGNEAFDQHVQKVVVQDKRATARQLGYGVR